VVTDDDGNEVVGLAASIAKYPKSTRGVYFAVASHTPSLPPGLQERILAEHEGYPGYPVSASNPMSKTARHWHLGFKKFKRSTAKGRQHDAQQNYLRTPVTRLEAAARSTTPSTTPLPVAGVKHSRPPSSPTTSNANGVHNRVTPNKAPHKKTSAGRGVVLTDPVRRALNDPPAPRRTSQLDLRVRQEGTGSSPSSQRQGRE
jgi:hypothetical protein